ncbi:hypothetical protein SEA_DANIELLEIGNACE_53 [Arthrobacter phage DanielleIgnace]|nr:hypothetical protein SEA_DANIELLEIGNACE_53 [Arthrobacter phage DanielleIgnace]
MTETTETKTPKPMTQNEEMILEQLNYQMDRWQKDRAKVLARVAEDKGSDWAVLGDLAAQYALDPQIRGLEWWLGTIKEGRFSVTEVIGFWKASVMGDLLNLTIGNSSSGASNLIKTEQLGVLQRMNRQIDAWQDVLDRKPKQ